jgi:MtN3 and saliva related transmembrane protein
MEITQIVGISAGIITAVAQLPQLVRIIKKKEAGDLSIWMLILLLTGLGLWTTYGILLKDLPIMITNALSFLINLRITFLRLYYKK